MSTKYTNIEFLNVDIDKLNDVKSETGISNIPAFLVYKNNTIVDLCVGADQIQLEALCAKYN